MSEEGSPPHSIIQGEVDNNTEGDGAMTPRSQSPTASSRRSSFSNHVKEEDVPIELDEDYRTCEMPPLPSASATDCPTSNASCRMGCICGSIKRGPIEKAHCGKPKCFFECTCLAKNGDGGDNDIKSRLRPRANQLNWKYMENDNEMDSPPVKNYRQLERGVGIYPRMRRVSKLKKDYTMSSEVKGSSKIKRNEGPPVVGSPRGVRKAKASKLFNQASAIHHRKTDIGQTKILNAAIKNSPGLHVRTGTGALDKDSDSVKDANHRDANTQPPLEVPRVIQAIERDSFLVLINYHRVCFVTYTVDTAIPRVVIYEKAESLEQEDEDIESPPWLYLPFCSAGETWLFHVMDGNEEEQRDDETSLFTHIPEIDCIVPTEVLQKRFQEGMEQNKTVALKMMWIGKDSKWRQGTMYMLPALPKVLICGPFPETLIKRSANRKINRVNKIKALTQHVDEMVGSKKNEVSPNQWRLFRNKEKERVVQQIQKNMKIDETKCKISCYVPEDIMILESCNSSTLSPDSSRSSSSSSISDLEYSMNSPNYPDDDEVYQYGEININDNGTDHLKISWKDAIRFLEMQGCP